jgi:(p)ppGpp synthase/HD superfamily hydrolase
MLTSDRVEYALIFAATKHEGQVRKGSDTPYITHPVAVSMMVSSYGGNEDQVIAALLHDTVEDCGGLPVLHEIRSFFGVTVANIVDALTDSYGHDTEPWEIRKRRYLKRLAEEPTETRLVATCDKLHNARAVLRDYQEVGECLWDRFTGRRDGSLWYYRSVADVLSRPGDVEPATELHQTVSELETAAASAIRKIQN